MYYVYVHTNKYNNKKYFGITNNVEKRWSYNGLYYKPDKENSSRFYNAILKWGWDSFSHEVIRDNMSFEEACELEKYYIRTYRTQNGEYGYNIAPGGNGGHVYEDHPKGMLGKHHTKEWCENHSKKMKENNPIKKGFWDDREHPRGMLGKHHTEEHKQKLREIPPHLHGSAKPIRVIYPNGEIKNYPCLKYCEQDLGVGNTWLIAQLKSDKPYLFSNNCTKNRELYKSLNGCEFVYLENTEVSK